MSNEPHALPDADELAHVDELPHDDETELIDQADQALPGESVEDTDLSVNDLVADGALPEDLEQDQVGWREVEADLQEPGHDDTIDERVRQEVPEEGFDVVPHDGR